MLLFLTWSLWWEEGKMPARCRTSSWVPSSYGWLKLLLFSLYHLHAYLYPRKFWKLRLWSILRFLPSVIAIITVAVINEASTLWNEALMGNNGHWRHSVKTLRYSNDIVSVRAVLPVARGHFYYNPPGGIQCLLCAQSVWQAPRGLKHIIQDLYSEWSLCTEGTWLISWNKEQCKLNI